MVLALLPPLDYRFFSAAARAWRSHTSQLYDAHVTQFFYAPWSLLLLVPLSFLPDRIGQAVFNLISLGSLWWSIWTLVRPVSFRALTLALATPFTAALLILGQWDGFIIGGIVLAWVAIQQRRPWLLGLALMIMTTKPTNSLLCLAITLYAVRGWAWRDLVQVLSIPLLTLAGAFLACGQDWPIRYITYIQTTPPSGYNISLWAVFGAWMPLVIACIVGGWLIWVTHQTGLLPAQLIVALVASLAISPFVVPYHYVGIAPALAVITQRHWRLGMVLWGGASIAFMAFILRWGDIPLVLYFMSVLVSSFILKRSGEATESGSPRP
jgi:hypothetical protein